MDIDYMALEIPIFAALLGLELWVGYTRGQAWYRFADAVTDLSCGLSQQLTGIFVRVAVFALYVHAHRSFALFEYTPGSWVPWLVAFLGVDFAYYWFHRMQHRVNLLWAIHAVHHQSEDYNFAVALRQPWLSDFTAILFYWPLPLLGVPLPIFLTAVAFLSLYQVTLHTRAVGKPGRYGRIFNTPSHHRVHHGRDPKYLDRNYGATLIVWDRLFGTFRAEDDEPLYGTVEPFRSWNPLWAQFHGFAEISRLARSARRPIDKLKVWFMPPGWLPEGASRTRGARSARPEPGVRFDPAVSAGLKRYVFAHFVLTMAAAWLLLTVERGSDPARWIGPVGLVMATLVAWGGLLEGRRWALPFELARLAALGAWGSWSAIGTGSGWGGAAVALGALLSAGWMVLVATRRIPAADSGAAPASGSPN